MLMLHILLATFGVWLAVMLMWIGVVGTLDILNPHGTLRNKAVLFFQKITPIIWLVGLIAEGLALVHYASHLF